MASVSDTLAVGEVFAVGPTQIAAVQALRGSGETDAKIASLISEGGGILEAMAASLVDSAPAPVRASPTPKAIAPDQKEKLTLLFNYYVLGGSSEDNALAQVKSLVSKDGHTDGTLEAIIKSLEVADDTLKVRYESMKEVDPAYIMEQAVALRTDAGGLFNVGNTCWFNSIVQAFFKEDGPYLEALVKQSKNPDQSEKAARLLQIIDLSNREVSPAINERLYELLTAFVDDLYKNSRGLLKGKGYQEDASEGLQALIDYLGLHDLISKQSPFKFSQRLFGKRTNTQSTKIGREPLLSLKQIEGGEPATSIAGLFALSNGYTETLTGENGCYFDGAPRDTEDTVKATYLSVSETPPKVGDAFPIAVPRFRTKLDDAGVASSYKDLTPIQFDPEITLPLYDESGSRTACIVTLQLQSIVCHNGSSTQSGHYTTYTRNDDGSYTEYNDAQLYEDMPLEASQYMFSTEGYLATYTVSKVKKTDRSQPSIDALIQNAIQGSDSGNDSPGTTPSPPPSTAAEAPREVSPVSSPVDGIDSVTLAQLLSLGFSKAHLGAIAGPLSREEFLAFVDTLLSSDSDEDVFFDAV